MSLPDFVVIGAGFSGSVFAERVSSVLNKKVLIIEKRDHIGGNSYDYKNSEGIFIHKYGPHIFHTDSSKVWNYLFKFTKFNNYKHRVFAFIDNDFIELPFDFRGVEKFFDNKKDDIKKTLLEYYNKGDKVPVYELLNSKDKLVKEIGEFVYEKIFFNYSKKQWGESPLNLSKDVLKRVPIYIGKKEGYFENKYEGIPKKGFNDLFEKILKNKNIKIRLKTDFSDIFKIKEGKIYLKNGEIYKGVLIYTGPIDFLFNYKFGKLPYRSLKFEFEEIKKEFYQKVAVVNYPNDYDFTRITEYKHFTGVKTEKTVISKEFPGDYDENSKNFNIPYYPILKDENINILNKYLEEAKKTKNLILIGRLSEYRYYNMDQVILRSLEIFEERYGNR